MSSYSRYYATAAFIAGILVTLGFKDFYPDLERRFRRRKGHTVFIDDDEELFGGLRLTDHTRRKSSVSNLQLRIPEGIEGCIGNTPLFRIKSLSEATGCDILAKAEVRIVIRGE